MSVMTWKAYVHLREGAIVGKRKKDESTMKEKPELNRRKSSQRGGMRKG